MSANLSQGYSLCSDDGFECASGSPMSAAYTALNGSGSVFYRNPSPTFTCGASGFGGDPSPNNPKGCFTAPIPSDIPAIVSAATTGIPTGFTKCADEGSTCNAALVAGAPAADILYGANGNYVYVNAKSVPCSKTVFGDPNNGKSANSCYYRNAAQNCPAGTSCQTGTTGTPSASCASGSTCQPTPIPATCPTGTSCLSGTTGTMSSACQTGFTCQKPKGLSTAAKIGIGAAVALLLILMIALIIYFVTKKPKPTTIKLE